VVSYPQGYPEAQRDAIASKLVVYASDQTHCTVGKWSSHTLEYAVLAERVAAP